MKDPQSIGMNRTGIAMSPIDAVLKKLKTVEF